MKKKIKVLYLGNNLCEKSKYKTSIAILSELLMQDFDLKVCSNKKNKIIRLLDMCYQLFLNRNKIDYLLIDTFSTSAFYFAYITSQIARLFKLRYIPILRGGDLPSRLDNSKNFSKHIFRNSFVNVAPSGYLDFEFNRRGFSTKLIPNVLDIAKYNFKERKNIQPKILYVRAFASIYNPSMAIYVLKELKKKYPLAELCMIGPDRDGSLSDIKKLVTELDLDSSVEFTGVLDKEQWHKKSEDYDIFINTTNFDNTPVSVMEVMALGLPVISTNVGGLPYLLKDKEDSILVEKNDIQSMTKAIDSLLSSEEKVVAMTKKARTKVEGFDWTIVKQKWEAILQNDV